MANDSEARLDNLGIELGAGPMLGRGAMLETGGQQSWDACTAGKEKVVTHWNEQCGSQDRAWCLSPSAGGGFAAGSALELAEAPSTAWRALGS